jgi:hypothetical protein
MVLTAAYIDINSNSLHSYGVKAQLAVEVDEKEVTNFSSAGWKEVLGGIKSGTLQLTFLQDVAAAAIDSIMWALLGTVVTFEVRLTQSAVGPSNPKYTGSVLVKSWTPLNGAVGDRAELDVSYPTSAAVTRATA